MKDQQVFVQRVRSMQAIEAVRVETTGSDMDAARRRLRVWFKANSDFDYSSLAGAWARLHFARSVRKPRIVSGRLVPAEPKTHEGEYVFHFDATRDEEFVRVAFAEDRRRSNIRLVELVCRLGSRQLENPFFAG